MVRALVAIAMHGYRGSRSFARSHPLPEFGIGRLQIQFRILIVGNNGENRSHPIACDDRQEMLAPVTTHSWTKIVEADEVSSWI